MGTTSKKVKVIGHEQWANPRTGELEDFQVVSIEDRDFNFHKVWLESIINSMDLLGNQKTRLAFWIISQLNKDNQLIMNQRQIAEKSGISLKTVSVTTKALMDSNFLRKINSGAYCINPDVLFKGTRNGRLNVLLQYNSLEQKQGIEEGKKNTKTQRPEEEKITKPAKTKTTKTAKRKTQTKTQKATA